MATITAPRIGASGGDVELSADIFGREFNEHLVWHVVRNEQLWQRQGSHATRTRGMVRGGGAKPWRQKGTGRARQGTRSAPQWAGGGVVFGPSPRSYGGKVNRRELRAALHMALAGHAIRGTMRVLGDEVFEKPSTKAAAALVAKLRESLGATSKITVVCRAEQEAVARSFRNIENIGIATYEGLAVADVMWGRGLVITESALARIEGRDS